MNKSKFDELFDETFQKAAKQLPDLEMDPSKAWERVIPKLEAARRKSQRRKRIIQTLMVVSFIGIGTFFLGQSQIVKAFNPLYQSISQMTENLVSFFFGNEDRSPDGAKTVPPPAGQIGTSNGFIIGDMKSVEIDPLNAQDKVSFTLPSFTVPDQFSLNRAEVFLPSDNVPTLSKEIRYTFMDTENGILRVTIKELEENSHLGSGVNKSGTNISVIQLKNNLTGYLTSSTDGSEKIEFLIGKLYVLIMGKISDEEMIDIAETISF